MKIPRLLSGGIIPTYCCSSACAHCLYACSPRRDKSYMDRHTADHCFKTVKKLGCRVMHVGGGEPFLQPEKLYVVLEAAADAGIHIEYVETNSSWCTSPGYAAAILAEIKSRGVDTLLLSISPFHNEYIPLRKILALMSACEASGVGIFPWTTEMLGDVKAFDQQVPHSLKEYSAKFGSSYIVDAMERYGVVPGGSAIKSLKPFFKRRSLEEILAEPPPCRRLTATTHFHVDLYRNYVPCQCPGLSIRLQDLSNELKDSDYPVLNALARDGVRGLFDLVNSSQYGFEPSEEGYSIPCELCSQIRRYLALDKKISSRELQPVEFYEEG